MPDPFQHESTRSRRPQWGSKMELATSHRGHISYKQSSGILASKGRKIDSQTFYNLKRKEGKSALSKAEQLELLMSCLESQGFHPRPRYEYTLENGRRTGQVLRDIFFISDEQIRLARRFASGFVYETDATFNTNSLRLPLSVMVGIDNTNSTFPMALMYITSESSKAFEFASQQLTDLVFYDGPEAAVICGDFAKELGAAIWKKAREERLSSVVSTPNLPLSTLDDDTIIVQVTVDNQQVAKLQLCEWHAVEAIKKRLWKAGLYSEPRREELVDLINKWVKAPTLTTLDEARANLLSKLSYFDRQHILDFYQPKEFQFCRVYTRKLANLGVHFTQRNESYHIVIKKNMNPHLSITQAVDSLVNQLSLLQSNHNDKINKQRSQRPRIYDADAFTEVGPLVTWSAITLVMKEWWTTKDLADDIEVDKSLSFEFNDKTGCHEDCQLPLRRTLSI